MNMPKRTILWELVGFSACERRGNQRRGPGPIHRSSSGKSRSFSANLDKHAYRCFSCGSSGNQLDLWAAVTNLDLYQATIQPYMKADASAATSRPRLMPVVRTCRA